MKAAASIFYVCIVLLVISFGWFGFNLIFRTTEIGIKIPENFAIGSGISAYQVEGAWNVDDKSESTYDKKYANRTQNGAVACDFYHKYKEDIKIAKDIGLNHFRLSISWTRILPTGSINNISKAGIQFYHNVIDEIRANGMEPFVTIYHWDNPSRFDEFHSWLDERMIDYLADFARVLFENFGSKVKFWTTINEPMIHCTHYSPVLFKNRFKCGQVMLLAHARVYHMYDKEFRALQGGKIGISDTCFGFFPVDSQNQACVSIAFETDCGLILNPIFSEKGDWSEIIKSRNDSTHFLPPFTPEQIQYVRNTLDYLGLIYYTARLCNLVPNSLPTENGFPDVNRSVHETWEIEDDSYIYNVPEGLRFLLNTFKEKYNNPPVYILENGCPNNQQLNDVKKINYLYSHMKAAILAREVDGCNVQKYMVWSFLDAFEWLTGFNKPWGLVQVEFNSVNLTRTPRLSAKWLAKVIRDRELIEYHEGMEL